ncbi:MAG: (2Fe-2S)-binding protein [Actinobacteria bacterium]|nr:(2Fe-2S)-binding protein [Actinomycetota bacterium]
MNKNTSGRIPLDGNIERGAAVTVDINGKPATAYLGESVATALLSEEIVAMRTTTLGESRGVFCGMGVCFDCLVVVDGKPNTRACMTWVKEGMDIRTQDGLKATN